MAAAESASKAPVLEEEKVEPLETAQKAALVVVSLGADRASQIYKYLSEQDIEDLTYEVAKMGKNNNAQVEGALDEFYKLCLTHKMMTDGGLDYARDVLEKAFGESTARNLLEKVSKTLQSKPFNFFTKVRTPVISSVRLVSLSLPTITKFPKKPCRSTMLFSNNSTKIRKIWKNT